MLFITFVACKNFTQLATLRVWHYRPADEKKIDYIHHTAYPNLSKPWVTGNWWLQQVACFVNVLRWCLFPVFHTMISLIIVGELIIASEVRSKLEATASTRKKTSNLCFTIQPIACSFCWNSLPDNFINPESIVSRLDTVNLSKYPI